MPTKIHTHRELLVYQRAFAAAINIHELTKAFPREETYSLIDQIRRSSRSVCTNLTEAWYKRRYEKAFINKLADAAGEAAETQVWIEFAVQFGFLTSSDADQLDKDYAAILRTLIGMSTHPETWIIQ